MAVKKLTKQELDDLYEKMKVAADHDQFYLLDENKHSVGFDLNFASTKDEKRYFIVVVPVFEKPGHKKKKVVVVH